MGRVKAVVVGPAPARMDTWAVRENQPDTGARKRVKRKGVIGRERRPARFISKLTANQAEDLPCRLNGTTTTRRRFRAPRPTAAQLSFIAELLKSVGFNEGWLQRFDADSISDIVTTEHARRIIAALRIIQSHCLSATVWHL